MVDTTTEDAMEEELDERELSTHVMGVWEGLGPRLFIRGYDASLSGVEQVS